MDTTFNGHQYESQGQNTDYFQMLAQVPLLYRLTPGGMITAKVHSWDEDTDLMATTTVSEALDDSETGIDVTTSALFQVGDYVLVDSEAMYVSAIASATELTVTRGALGTTAAAHDNGSTITIIGKGSYEGQTTPSARTTTISTVSNYIFEIQTPFSASDMAILGNSTAGNVLEYAKTRSYLRHLVSIERMIYYAVGTSVGATTTAPYAKGFMGFVTSHSYAITSADIGGAGGNTTITAKKFNKTLELIANTGGSGTYEVQCGPTAFGAIQAAFRAEGQAPIAALGGTYGSYYLTFNSEFGVCQFIYNRNIPTGTMEIIDVGHDPMTAGFRIMEYAGSGIGLTIAPQIIEHGKTGTFTSGAFVSRATLEARLVDKCCGRITSITAGG